MSSGPDLKEKVLHTRVPEALENEIKTLAEALRVPVSGLVRNILEDTVRAIQDSGLDETLRSVSKNWNVKNLSSKAKADHDHLRRGWTEFQSMLRDRLKARATELKEAPARPAKPEPVADPFANVLGWQPLTLHRESTCAACAKTMATGERAYLGLGDGSSSARVIACADCYPHPDNEKGTTT